MIEYSAITRVDPQMRTQGKIESAKPRVNPGAR